MFRHKTVFILGAGASWHYGYPTGDELVRKVAARAHALSELLRAVQEGGDPALITLRPKFTSRILRDRTGLEGMRADWGDASQELRDLATRLREVRPLLIDHFLGHNKNLRAAGKLMIAWVIVECELSYLANGGNINRRELLANSPFSDERVRAAGVDLGGYSDAWYRFITHQLISEATTSADLLQNNVHFITFNYDISLELHLFGALSSIQRFDLEDIKQFFSGNRVTHVYGQVRKLPALGGGPAFIGPMDFSMGTRPNASERGTYVGFHQALARAMDFTYEASKNLRTIDPHDKEGDPESLETARLLIRDAECVYILGYGFDRFNSQRLDMDKHLRDGAGQRKCVMFTNYKDSNLVNKRASNLFFGRPDMFLPPRPPIEGILPGPYYEKSVRDVYEALESDFESLEGLMGADRSR